MKRHKLFLTVALLLIASGAAAGASRDIRLTAYTDKRSVLIGDRIKYTVEVRYTGDVKLEFPKFKDDKIGEFEIKDSGRLLKKSIFGKRVYYKWYFITSFSAGKQTIPSIEVKYGEKIEKEWSSRKTGTIDIMVASVLPRSGAVSDIRDIKGPLRFFEINYFYVAGAFIILLIILAAAEYRKWKRRGPKRLPHETAFEELEAMKALLARTGDIKGYYVGVSDCIRRYIERVFKLRAPEMTTEEFLNSLHDSAGLSIEQKGLLKDFLNACDLVKFAKYVPARAEIESVFTTAKIFIEQTSAGLTAQNVK